MIRAWFVLLLAATGLLGAAPAQALSPEAAGQAVAKRFEVKVLKVTPVEREGRNLYAVVVMNPGGNFNEAFKVSTLMVDRDSGDLVAQFRHEDSGYALPEAADRQPPAEDGGAAARRETFRGR